MPISDGERDVVELEIFRTFKNLLTTLKNYFNGKGLAWTKPVDGEDEKKIFATFSIFAPSTKGQKGRRPKKI